MADSPELQMLRYCLACLFHARSPRAGGSMGHNRPTELINSQGGYPNDDSKRADVGGLQRGSTHRRVVM
jgi:hypothetical protein